MNVGLGGHGSGSGTSLTPVLAERNSLQLRLLSFDAEIDSYLALTLTGQSIDPSLWWAENAKRYPSLEQLFYAFQAIPTSSSSSEVAFKTASKFLRQDRAMLSPAKVNKLCFMNKNIDLLEENGVIHTLRKLTDL